MLNLKVVIDDCVHYQTMQKIVLISLKYVTLHIIQKKFIDIGVYTHS